MATDMDLEIAPASESDIDQVMDVQFSAFENDPYHEALFPGDHFSPAVRKSAGKRTLQEWRADPTIRFMKCFNRQTGLILGYAKWNLYESERSAEERDPTLDVDWCTGRQREIAENFLGATLALREKIWGGRPYICRNHVSNLALRWRSTSVK